ncbi:magnesium/cobalt transporter CorA [Micrococcales bacterium 31B]|nr:magnesium/cobalt transporter CorA [Micrococcales bacterium 31B]
MHPNAQNLRRITMRVPRNPFTNEATRLMRAPLPRHDADTTPHDALVDAAIYESGRRVASPRDLTSLSAELASRPGATAWIGLYQPDQDELERLGDCFGLHELAVEDAVHAHQRSKIERYGDTLFVVIRAVRYLDDAEEIEFSELHLFMGENFIITVRHGGTPDLAAVRRRLESTPELLAKGPEAIMYAILDAAVDGYRPVVEGLANDIDEIETEVFLGDPEVSRRIYELNQEVIQFQRCTQPMRNILTRLDAGAEQHGVDEEMRQYLRDVADHTQHANERVEEFRVLLRDILTVNATLVAQRQNEEMKNLTEVSLAQNEEVKKISAWAAILFTPTLVGTIYGMNFDHMPELHWQYGYPASMVAMVLLGVVLYGIFKRRGWI